MAATNKPTTTKMPSYSSIDATLAGGLLPGGAKPAGAKDPQLKADKEAQASCRAAGGQWDPVKKACIMPKDIKNQTETTTPTQGSFSKEQGGFKTDTGQIIPNKKSKFCSRTVRRTNK
jgi:hypothetical protein